MSAAPAPIAPAEGDLELAADQAIAACGGDPREAVKALLEVRSKVSTGYARGRLPAARERKDEADV